MHVLVVHNRYRSTLPSGENDVVDEEIRLLSEAGVEVTSYLRSSDEIAGFGPFERAALAARPFYSVPDTAAIRDIIREKGPDLLHLHNPYPLISPAVIRVARREGVPVVQTVHNHRHVCSIGTFFRDNHVCRECVGKRLGYPAVIHACYQGSRPASAVMATALAVHRRTFRMVSEFIALTEQIADSLRSSLGPDIRVSVKPNTAADPGPPAPVTNRKAVFVGRLSGEKGVHMLVDAWRQLPADLREGLTIIGDGDERRALAARARDLPDVALTGLLTREEVAAHIAQGGVVVVPSRGPEALPRVVVESFAAGRAVVATQVGGLSSLVTPEVGWLAEPTVDALATQLASALKDVSDLAGKGGAARRTYLQQYAPDVVMARQIEIYDRVVGRSPHE